jgi:hypothetical protein
VEEYKMRKYDSKILKALVIAYKNGIINIKPLSKWVNKKNIFNNIIKYISMLIICSFTFLIFNDSKTNFLDDSIIIQGYIINKSRLVSGIVILLVSFVFYQLIKYIWQVYLVKRFMKSYTFTNNDITILDKVTYKIQV